MSIYGRTVRGHPENPAKALYRYWHSILKPITTPDPNGFPMGSTHFGKHHDYGIGIVRPDPNQASTPFDDVEYGTPERPVLGFGYVHWWNNSVFPKFKLKANGDFILQSVHGDKQRMVIADNTFLDFAHGFSDKLWFVNTDDHVYGTNLVKNWRTPIEYIDQSFFMRNVYGYRPAWMHLEPAGRQWKIKFSRPSEMYYFHLQHMADRGGCTREGLDKQDALRLRRYRLLKMSEQIQDGTVVPRGKRMIPAEEIEQRREAQALALATHLAVRGQTKPQLEGV